MLTVKIEGLDEVQRSLTGMASGQVPFAAAVAITKTAKSVEQKIQDEMGSVFKSASPYVKRATFVQAATKSNLSATVGLKDQKPSGGTAPAVLLKEHFTGGARGNKPFEKAIIALGAMPSGYRAVPGAGMKLDSYGNPNRRDIGEMLGALRSRIQVWKGKGKKVELIGFFVVPVGAQSRLHPGIYKRLAHSAIKAMFMFVSHASYNKLIDLERSASAVVSREFQHNFDQSFADALRTAR